MLKLQGVDQVDYALKVLNICFRFEGELQLQMLIPAGCEDDSHVLAHQFPPEISTSETTTEKVESQL